MSARNEYEIIRLVPGEMVVRIPESVAGDGASFEEHIVTLTSLSDGSFHIDDSISVQTDQNVVFLMRGDERLIKVGNDYTYSELVSVMGQPSSYNIDVNNGRIMVFYPGLVLRFDGQIDDASNWSATLTSARILSNSSYTLGYYLYVGMNRTQLLISYPFIDDENYELIFISGTKMYYISFMFNENGDVTNIRISV